MPATQLQTLIVGTGDRIERVLLPALSTVSAPVRVTAICDLGPSDQRITALTNDGLVDPETPVFTDLDQALDAGPYDMAVLTQPNDQHHTIALRLAEYGIPVWREEWFAFHSGQAADGPTAKTEAEEAIQEHANAGADLVIDALDLGDRDTDLINLVVNAACHVSEQPEASFDAMVRAKYDTDPNEVRDWWDEWS